jgi:hypothetical protein
LSANAPRRFSGSGAVGGAFRIDVRDLGGDGPRPERLGQPELVVDDLVGHAQDVVDLDDLDEDAGILELLAQRLCLVHRDGQPPLADLVGSGLARRVLLGRRGLGVAAAGRAAAAVTSASGRPRKASTG